MYTNRRRFFLKRVNDGYKIRHSAAIISGEDELEDKMIKIVG